MAGNMDLCFAYEASREGARNRVRRIGEAHFEVRMTSDGPHPDRRLDLRLENRTGAAVPVTVTVDWGDPRWAIFCDHLFVRPPRQRDWRMFPSRTEGTRTVSVLEARPGRTLAAFCPIYSNRDCAAFVRRVAGSADPRVSTATAGRSTEGRQIQLITIGRGAELPNCLVVSRCHGYETAGNFCVEGMVRFLLSGDPIAEFFLDRHTYHFIPTMNVDAVANGDARLTCPGGADLNRDIDCNRCQRPGSETDGALLTHFRVMDELKPDLYLNLHNWTAKFRDGLIGWDQEEVDVFRSFMPDQATDFKRWQASVTIVPGNRSPGRYCRETFGTIGFVLEFPWYGRTASRMRHVGETALKALVHTGMHLRKKQQLAALSG